MKKYYVRLYGAMAGQSGSASKAEELNQIIETCVQELRDQGLNIESLPCGSGKNIVYDVNGTPMSYSAFTRACVTAKIKYNNFLWKVHNKYHQRKASKAKAAATITS